MRKNTSDKLAVSCQSCKYDGTLTQMTRLKSRARQLRTSIVEWWASPCPHLHTKIEIRRDSLLSASPNSKCRKIDCDSTNTNNMKRNHNLP
eukprot:CAMPEP_0176144414 /NCGR_PEP_ID=MMETSP0120_2-20121206/73528_1 /TAXON_ID=160619 /ORGANISM="Kryptoperidinium foliaceum, Strain CCMP 1326" /LENGTH=90 /DNA_ID=CAMNT_0017480789 /DNA_START=372 /DNA_END=644 /DNA_ORIENTATION=+